MLRLGGEGKSRHLWRGRWGGERLGCADCGGGSAWLREKRMKGREGERKRK